MDLTALPHNLDKEKLECRAIIETPKGRRSKFHYDPAANLFRLSSVLPQGMIFPFDFGFIPSTIAEDGDPLDLMLLLDEPAHVGCLVDVRLVGVLEAEQTENGKTQDNDRLLGVAILSYQHQEAHAMDAFSKSVVDQIGHFFVSYNELRGKKFKLKGHGGPQRALAILEKGIQRYREKHA